MNVFPQMNPDEPTAPTSTSTAALREALEERPKGAKARTPGPCEPSGGSTWYAVSPRCGSAALQQHVLQVHSQGAATRLTQTLTHPACPQHLKSTPWRKFQGLINTHFQCSARLVSCHHKWQSHNETCHMPTTRLQGRKTAKILSMDEDVKQTLNSCEVLL